MTGTGTWPMLALAPPDEVRVEAADRAAGGEEQRRAAEDRHAAERHHEGRHLEPGDGEALQEAAGQPDGDRRERRELPAIAERVLALADGEAVGDAALGDGGGDQPGEGEQRADREVDAGGEDDEGHADREQAVDRHLAHDVEQVERRSGSAARRWRRPPSARSGRSAARSAPGSRTTSVFGRCRLDARCLGHLPSPSRSRRLGAQRHHRHQLLLGRLGRA